MLQRSSQINGMIRFGIAFYAFIGPDLPCS